jgi:hypothetical protein
MEPITITIAGIKFIGLAAVKIKLLVFYWKVKSLIAAAGISAETLSIAAVGAMLTAAIDGESADKILKTGLKNGLSDSLSRFITYEVIRA